MLTSYVLPNPSPSSRRPAASFTTSKLLVAIAASVMLATACGSSGEIQPVVQPGISVDSNPVQSATDKTPVEPVSTTIGAAEPQDTESAAASAPTAEPEPETAIAENAAAQDAESSGEDSALDDNTDNPVDQRPVIASAEGTSRFPELWIHSFRREGDIIRLDFTVGVQALELGESYYLRKTFSSIEDSELTGNASNSLQAASFSGITLVDSVNNNRHLVLRDTEGDCLCTSFPDYFISDDYPEYFKTPGAALFPAPPQDVTSMTVMFPVFGSFELEIENV